jgi:prevent-host-death family protein
MVGIRELRQNLSKYLERVVRGETLQVTDRGRPVAVLAPLPEQESALGRLQRDGQLERARVDLAAIGSPPERPHAMPISVALAAQRAED